MLSTLACTPQWAANRRGGGNTALTLLHIRRIIAFADGAHPFCTQCP